MVMLSLAVQAKGLRSKAASNKICTAYFFRSVEDVVFNHIFKHHAAFKAASHARITTLLSFDQNAIHSPYNIAFLLIKMPSIRPRQVPYHEPTVFIPPLTDIGS